LKLEAKQKITEDLHERLAKSVIIVLTDYKGLDVTSINDLRRKLRSNTRLSKTRFWCERRKIPRPLRSKIILKVRAQLR